MSVPSWAIPYIEKLKCIWMKANNEDNFRDFTNVPVKNGAYGERFFWNNRENYSYSHIQTSSSHAFLPMVKFDVTITFENDKYVYNTSSYTPVTSGVVGYNSSSFASFYPQNFDSNGIWIGNGQGRNPDTPSSNQFDTLSDCIIYISEHFTNIGSLTVLGEDWTNPTPSYNWQSVQAITGKDGASLALTQIGSQYIDEGEPVSGAAADCFDGLLRSNRVATLIDAALPEPEVGGTTVTVHYVIEAPSSGSYTYCKLVAKRNKIPNTIEDGDKVIDINPAQNKVTVRNLRALTKYYFVIFVKDSNNIEGISDPESITTGEVREIEFFTDSFNSDLMKNGWDLATFKSAFGDGSTVWAPTSFSSDFLSTYNFLIGNYNRDIMVEDNGILRNANYNHGASDSVYWIPIDRVYGKIRSLEWDYCNLQSAYGSYDAIAILIGWVDSSNEWHQATVAWITQLWSSEWQHGEYTDLSIENSHIDYIGIYTCDGKPACKNIKFTIE